MSKLAVKDIQTLALEIVAETPDGIRYSALVAAISKTTPETPINTIHGSVWDLHTTFPEKVTKPSRGLFVPVVTSKSSEVSKPVPIKVKEEDFYESFSQWLQNDLNECTKAFPLGGAALKGKWSTPDVVGTYKPMASDLIKFPIEIVAAEMKIDAGQPVTAFGQAVAYRLFSTKTYLALPSSMTPDRPTNLKEF